MSVFSNIAESVEVMTRVLLNILIVTAVTVSMVTVMSKAIEKI